MDDDLIPDKSIDSSSILNSQYTHSQGRLNSQSSETLKGCWAPASNEKFQYVQVKGPAWGVTFATMTRGQFYRATEQRILISILKQITSQNTHILCESLSGYQQNLLSKYFL